MSRALFLRLAAGALLALASLSFASEARALVVPSCEQDRDERLPYD